MKRTSLLPVSIFSAAYLLIATPFAIAHHNTEFLFYIGIVIIFAAMIYAIHQRANFSSGLLWGLSIWGLLHMMGGLVPVPDSWPTAGTQVLYSLWLIPGYLKYDNPIHAYGFAVATWACWEALSHTVKGIKPTFGILTLCALGGMGLGSVNEIIEFAATLLIPGTNVGGYVNTGWDLVANAVGSVTTVILIRLLSKK
jgi:uncharacterized membrane protein YjdF